jgi:ATP-dependent DNA helicase RecG
MSLHSYMDAPVTSLPGIGRVKGGLFGKMGIETLEDLLYHFPRAYQHRGDVCLLSEGCDKGLAVSTVLTVGSAPASVRLSGGRVMTRFTAFDDSGKCVITFFNQPYIKDLFFIGTAFRFWGKVERKGRNFTMSCPEFEPYSAEYRLPDFLPVYPLTEGLKNKAVSQAVGLALQSLPAIADPLPEEVRKSFSLPTLEEALKAVHMPSDYEELASARRRFVFEELFLFSLGMASSSKKEEIDEGERLPKADLTPFLSALPFSLTGGQQKTVNDILKDLSEPYPMSRLVCGDVGSGKTACAAAAAYAVMTAGRQVALMVPTEILAAQHYADLAPLFEKLGFRTALLTGALTPSLKKRTREEIKNGTVDLVIGTQALLTGDTVFCRPGLVITDEQHRFGVNQRALLGSKGKALHTLVMTATPIPRTLALILYRNLDISYIDELPPGRQKVSTFKVDESYRSRLNGFIEKQVKEGRQVYVVCPAVESEDPENGKTVPFGVRKEDLFGSFTEAPTLKAAVDFSTELQKALPDIKVGFLHGKMKSKEKDAVMAAFAQNEIGVLVSTTVIEVGVNVPNATLMVVENAERFGMSQLHQLRGRVGRGKDKSYCILVSEAKEDSAAGKRLAAICQNHSGYDIANEDLKQRGPGDFFPRPGQSTRQSGEFSFSAAFACDDPKLPPLAAMAAQSLYDQDPLLEEHPSTKRRMNKLFAIAANTVN